MSNEEIVKKWIDDLTFNGYMGGWMGDKSEAFKKTQFDYMMSVVNGTEVEKPYRLLAIIHSDYMNLQMGCNWTKEELDALLSLFNFKTIRQVAKLMNYSNTEISFCLANNKLITPNVFNI